MKDATSDVPDCILYLLKHKTTLHIRWVPFTIFFRKIPVQKFSTLCMTIRWSTFFRWHIRQKILIIYSGKCSYFYITLLSYLTLTCSTWSFPKKIRNLPFLFIYLLFFTVRDESGKKGIYRCHSENNSMIELPEIFDEQMAVLGVWLSKSQNSIFATVLIRHTERIGVCDKSESLY